MPRCTATSKQSGQQCKRRAALGRNVCSIHGGKTPVGPAAPGWIDGRHSKRLPKRLLEDYQVALADPDRLSLAEELAVLDARLNDVLGRVDTGESGRLWRELSEAWRRFEKARRQLARTKEGSSAWEAAQFTEMVAHEALADLMARGESDWSTWDEVFRLVGQRQRLVESERKRLIEAHQVIAIDQAMTLLALLVDAVRRTVTDDAVLRAVTAEYARLTGAPARRDEPEALSVSAPPTNPG